MPFAHYPIDLKCENVCSRNIYSNKIYKNQTYNRTIFYHFGVKTFFFLFHFPLCPSIPLAKKWVGKLSDVCVFLASSHYSLARDRGKWMDNVNVRRNDWLIIYLFIIFRLVYIHFSFDSFRRKIHQIDVKPNWIKLKKKSKQGECASLTDK